MVNQIIAGVAQALAQTFPDAEIYQEAVRQDFQEPCFFIRPLSVSRKAYIGGRRQITCPVNVIYFPGSQDDPYAEMAGLGAQMFSALELITVGGLTLLGDDLHFEMVDGVLHFFATYTLFTVPVETGEPMGELMQNAGVKEV